MWASVCEGGRLVTTLFWGYGVGHGGASYGCTFWKPLWEKQAMFDCVMFARIFWCKHCVMYAQLGIKLGNGKQRRDLCFLVVFITLLLCYIQMCIMTHPHSQASTLISSASTLRQGARYFANTWTFEAIVKLCYNNSQSISMLNGLVRKWCVFEIGAFQLD